MHKVARISVCEPVVANMHITFCYSGLRPFCGGQIFFRKRGQEARPSSQLQSSSRVPGSVVPVAGRHAIRPCAVARGGSISPGRHPKPPDPDRTIEVSPANLNNQWRCVGGPDNRNRRLNDDLVLRRLCRFLPGAPNSEISSFETCVPGRRALTGRSVSGPEMQLFIKRHYRHCNAVAECK